MPVPFSMQLKNVKWKMCVKMCMSKQTAKGLFGVQIELCQV